MLSEQIKAIVSDDKRREAIRGVLSGLAQQGKLYLTPILMLEEPYRTQCLEVMDGIAIESGRPAYGARPKIKQPPIRLVAVTSDGRTAVNYNPKGHIKQKQVVSVPILGTGMTKDEAQWIDLGADVTIDAVDARVILARTGHPMCDRASNGNIPSTVVEYAWLKWEASQPNAPQYAKDLLEQIDQATSPAPTTKKGAQQQATL